MSDTEYIEKIKAKVVLGEPISRQEEKDYMINVLGWSPAQVERILAIVENDNPNVIID